MNNQDVFGMALKLNGVKVPTQEEWCQWTLHPKYEYPFNSPIITKYRLQNLKTGQLLDITPERLFQVYLKDLIEKLEE